VLPSQNFKANISRQIIKPPTHFRNLTLVMKTPMSRFTLLPVATLALFLVAACGTSQKQADTRTEQLQAQLDKTQKELEALKARADQQQASPPAAAPAPTEQAATTPAPKPAAPKEAALKTQKATKSNADRTSAVEADLAATKAAGKKAISEDRAAIAANKADIEANRSRISTAQQTADEAKRMAAPPPSHTIAAGTPIVVRTTSKITTKSAASGSLFEATLEEPLTVDGYVLAGKGASVEGIVTKSDPGGRAKGVASITIALRSLVAEDGRRMPLKTDTVSEEAGKSKGKDLKRGAITTGIGAAIGAIAGGGSGAAIGAGAGAAGGVGLALATRGNAAEIDSEAVLNFKLTAPLKFQELKK
jgi:hypothetical protein